LPTVRTTGAVGGGEEGRVPGGPLDVCDVIGEVLESDEGQGGELGGPEGDRPIEGGGQHQVLHLAVVGLTLAEPSRLRHTRRRRRRVQVQPRQRSIVPPQLLKQPFRILHQHQTSNIKIPKHQNTNTTQHNTTQHNTTQHNTRGHKEKTKTVR